HEGQQDALALAKYASASGMGGILYKTLPGRQRPMQTLRAIQEELKQWADESGVEPIKTWAGWNIGIKLGQLATAEEAVMQIEDGIRAVWMPNNTHANTLMLTPSKSLLEKAGKPAFPPDTIPWEFAREMGGNYLLDDAGKLLPGVQDIFRVIADKN